ncbi:MAG TPA: carboxypeptidase-like regulatory domain-containing protein [Polyangiaceae bacterium]|nr:carboxypeptidase-like regulatory domain-containing protein [Polyangiaceae bacterium]
MRSISVFALVWLGALASGCTVIDGEPTDEQGDCLVGYITPTVHVRDVDGRSICDASVVAREGGYEVALTRQGTCGAYRLPDRRGIYAVTVEAPGYRRAVREGVRAGLDSYAGYGCAGPPSSKTDLEVRLEAETPECDTSAALSFLVDLRDEAGAPVCDARVVVRDGAFVQELRPSPAPGASCFWDGPAERPGSYEVTISKPGYETIVLPSVVVTKAAGACHVTPAKIEAQLAPAETPPAGG